MANKPTSPQDSTGRAAEIAAKRNAEELQKRKDEISISRAAEADLLETAVFDPKKPDAPLLIDEIEEVGVINGTPQSYTFKAGVKYSVPRALAAYLENLGYTWKQ